MPIIISGVIPVNLTDLHDVSISAPQSGQYLRYSGFDWQNSSLNSDVFSYLNTSLTSTNGVTLDFSIPNNISIGLATVNPTAGTFGSASSIPVFTVDSQGRITSITTAISSGAASATVLSTARNISASGDATWSVLFDGSADVTSALTLAIVNPSPVADAFQKITTNSKGLVTSTSAVTVGDIEAALTFTPVNIAGDTMTGALILNADPTLPLGAVTKQYADGIASGVNIHASCETATATALTVIYDNGASGVGATLTSSVNSALGTVGGYSSLAIGSRLLVKDQSAQLQNGIYVVTDLGSPTTPFILTRATDFDGSPTSELQAGDLTYISEGTYAGTQWVETALGTGLPGDYIVVGTNPITFTQFSGPGAYSAGTGINISATTISNTGVTSLIAGTNVSLSASTGSITISTTGTVPSSTTSTNLASGIAGNVPYQSAPGATSYVTNAAGVLQAATSGATPAWTTTPTLTGTNFSGTAASLNIGGNAGTVTNGLYTTGVGTITNTMLAGSIANVKLANSTITVGTTAISLGTSSTTLTGLTSVSSTTFTGSGSGLTSIPNSALVGSGSITLGSTAMALGSTIVNVSGLTSVTSTTFTGTLSGTATYVSATQQTNIITGKQQSMNMGASSADGSFTCRATGTGDANMAGIVYWNDAYAIKMGIRADGYFGLGGWSRAAWSWYSDPSGNMVAAGNVSAYSDPRLKENIKPITGAVALLSSIDGVYFDWKHGIPHTEVKAGKTDIGILADQVEAVFPEIVTESVEVEGQRYKTVAYDKLVPVLIEAIKELSAANKDLLARIQALEAK
jgi:hypothetical protein